jgi:hypothetical protein
MIKEYSTAHRKKKTILDFQLNVKSGGVQNYHCASADLSALHKRRITLSQWFGLWLSVRKFVASTTQRYFILLNSRKPVNNIISFFF